MTELPAGKVKAELWRLLGVLNAGGKLIAPESSARLDLNGEVKGVSVIWREPKSNVVPRPADKMSKMDLIDALGEALNQLVDDVKDGIGGQGVDAARPALELVHRFWAHRAAADQLDLEAAQVDQNKGNEPIL